MKRLFIFWGLILFILPCAFAQGEIAYRFAEREEGVELLLSNSAYYESFTQNDLDYRVQKKDATLEEWLEFAGTQIMEFSEWDRKLISDAMDDIEAVLDENGYALPELDEIVLIRTTGREEGGNAGYSLGNQIYVGDGHMNLLRSRYKTSTRYGRFLLCHELFHCLTRSHPRFRQDMYAVIGFTAWVEDFEPSEDILAISITNPDVGRHNASATFTIDGQPTECFVATLTPEPFEKPGDSFTDRFITALIPVERPDVYYTPEDASDFWDVFGRNTEYVIDPEECMADNFGFALIYDGTNILREPLQSMEIIDAIREYLQSSAN